MRFARVSDVYKPSHSKHINGGGVSVVASPLELEHCVITRNVASMSERSYLERAWGGGLAAVAGSAVSMDSCDVSFNTVTGEGQMTQTMFFDSGFGGGIVCENSTMAVTSSRISHNIACGSASAAAGDGLRLRNCIIDGNGVASQSGEAPMNGGFPHGLYCVVADCLESCTFSGNTITWYEYYGATHTCVASGVLANCIVRCDSGNALSDSCKARYCNIQMDSTDVFPGEGNINADPALRRYGERRLLAAAGLALHRCRRSSLRARPGRHASRHGGVGPPARNAGATPSDTRWHVTLPCAAGDAPRGEPLGRRHGRGQRDAAARVLHGDEAPLHSGSRRGCRHRHVVFRRRRYNRDRARSLACVRRREQQHECRLAAYHPPERPSAERSTPRPGRSAGTRTS